MDFSFEKNIFNQGYEFIGAIDEAGRGPLAGPVVAACVLTDRKFNTKLFKKNEIKDSKKLSAKKREDLYVRIMENFTEVGVGVCEPETIDRINILEASFLAMKKAIGSLREKPGIIILDGQFEIPRISLAQKAIIKGDNKVLSIAAASIIAKVTRDRIMLNEHKKYPVYGFEKHKGYATKLHLERLRGYGPCKIHRQSYKPVSQCVPGSVLS